MFDLGSQRTYVNEHLKEILNLKTLGTEKHILKIFGNEKSSAKLFDVVKIKLNGMKKDFVIEVLVVPQICSPITNQIVTRVSRVHCGLCLLPLVQGIFLRFRVDKTAAVADIQQACLQKYIAETHRNLLQFLWFKGINNSDVVKTLRFARVKLGLTCSPFF